MTATVSFKPTDNLSGVASAEFNVNGGALTSGTSLFLDKNGVYIVRYRSTDVAGNVERLKSISVRVVIIPCKGNICI